MAVLPEVDRLRIWRGVQRHWSKTGLQIGAYTKADLKAAVDTTDDWIDANQGSFNAALPQPFRGEASLLEKTLVFCGVALARADGIALLRLVFGEVD